MSSGGPAPSGTVGFHLAGLAVQSGLNADLVFPQVAEVVLL